MDNISKLTSELREELKKSDSLKSLDNLHIKYLGRKGLINELLQSIFKLSPEGKKELGKKSNAHLFFCIS